MISLGSFLCRDSILDELEFGDFVFCDGGKMENPEKNPRTGENQQQTHQIWYRIRIEPRIKLVEDERSHYSAIRAPYLYRN